MTQSADALETLKGTSDPKLQEKARATVDGLRIRAAAELREQQAAIADMNTNANILRSQYDHVYEVGGAQGTDGNFYPAATARPRPPAPSPSMRKAVAPAGKYAGQVLPRSALGEFQKRAGLKSVNEAEYVFTHNGGVVQ